MALPFGPPVAPMLAKLDPEIPRGEGWRYEPKWDGFRAIVFPEGSDVLIQSRDARPLERYFPELVSALREAFPPGTVGRRDHPGRPRGAGLRLASAPAPSV